MAEKSTDTGSGRRGREPEDSLDRRGKAVLGDAGLDQPERVGPYKILERLGEGGMGTVYLAEQSEPIRRRVALKIIKLGMDTKEVVGRFEAERQALALMNHPNVAKVFDAGATETGRPYFVMEHVPGVPITEYCDRERLTTKQRLDLFGQVCNAVQHAHQKGIIHRDIKPSNVLVMVQDGRPVPKVIDFGLAKALHQRLTEKTVFTEQGRLIGTPEYMSPEQAEMTAVDIDTRTDIYSLGVLLYELLVGSLPFEPKALREAGYDAVHKIIRESTPPKPSTKLSSWRDQGSGNGDQGTGESSAAAAVAAGAPAGRRTSKSSILEIARRRRTDPPSLIRTIRGDLDWIVMKCLEKDRTRRYDTANALAMEIERHLNNEPVLAGPPSTSYRVRKFVRRNRTGVASAAVVLVVLLAGITGTTWGLIRAGVARDGEARQRKVAETEAANAKAINDFLTEDLLAAVAPSAESGKGKDVLMRDVFDEASKKIDTASAVGGKFANRPLIEASIRTTLGSTYLLLGEYAAAEPHLERVRLLSRRELGEEHRSTLASMNNLAALYRHQGRYIEAEVLYVKTLEIQKRDLGEEHPDTLASMNNLAIVYTVQGRYVEAEVLYVKTVEIKKRDLGEEHPNTLNSMHNLAILYGKQGHYDEEATLFVKILAIRKRILGGEHPDTLKSMSGLALVYGDQGRAGEAEPLRVKTLEIQKRVLGEEHPDTLLSMNNLAGLYKDQGRYDEAETLYVKTLQIKKRVLGEEHPGTLGSMNNLANLYLRQGRYDEAEPLYVKTLEIAKPVLGEEHPQTLASMNNLAALYDGQGRYDEAEPLKVKTLEIKIRVLGEEHRDTLGSITNLGNLYLSMKRFDDARATFERSLPIKRRVLGMSDPWTRYALEGLARAYDGLDRGDDALPLWRELQEFQLAQVEDPDASAQVLNAAAWDLLTNEHAELRDAARALLLAQRAVEQVGGGDPGILDTLALAQHLTGDTPAAIETEKKALSLLPPDAPGRGDYEAALAKFEAALKEARAAKKPGGG